VDSRAAQAAPAISERLAAVGPRNRKQPGLELNILLAGLEQVRRDLLALQHHIVARLRGAAPPTTSDREP
jgi:hypothetical protein